MKEAVSTMSMIGNFLQISPAELAELIDDPSRVEGSNTSIEIGP
jgi:hypothetical protein